MTDHHHPIISLHAVLLIIIAAMLPELSASAQDYIESSTFNSDFRGARRVMQYHPENDRSISSHNGTNLYTRALYGGFTPFRIETSDVPIFAAYHKTDNRNIHFIVHTNGSRLRLDSVADCYSYYSGGERRYRLTDPSWGKGSIEMTVVAAFDREVGLWKVDPHNMPDDAILTVNTCATRSIKLNRSGDIGADPANAFAPDSTMRELKSASVKIGGHSDAKYLEYSDRNVRTDDQSRIAIEYEKTQNARDRLTSRLVIDTPDPYFNTLGGIIMAAGDGLWDGMTWQHGAVGWRMPLSGWRGAYTGDFLGWHDRARTHFNAYAASQVTSIEPVIHHPAQDTGMRLARAEKRWGTPMYSNGYICRNPERNDQMHHYDMNLCYIDELLWHLNWTGDIDYARKMWPVIKSHLAWEKRNYDPDNDALYDAYCCIWASDALYYNSGAVTHSSAYNYRANKLAANIAAKIGEDPGPYADEAAKILRAINTTLWMLEKGVWAEFKDFMGHKRRHDHPAVWTIYHAVDSDIANPFQAYSATRYIDNHIPHIPVIAEGLDNKDYATISTTDWMPYAWSINNVAFAEVMHTALAYWEARRNDEAFRLMKSSILDGMYLGCSPGNIGQISFYDAARGECYRDFGDPVGVISRAIVQGLFGFVPDAINGRLTLQPGFPSDWDHASIKHPDFSLSFNRAGNNEIYELIVGIEKIDNVSFRINAPTETLKSVKINGKPAKWSKIVESVDRPSIEIQTKATHRIDVEIEWAGTPVNTALAVATGAQRNGFRELRQRAMTWWEEIPTADSIDNVNHGLDLMIADDNRYEPIDITQQYNADITDIFHNRYLSPRSPYTTLQIPIQGIGEWCHPHDTAHIDDSGLRAALDNNGILATSIGIPFKSTATGHNVIYTSLFDNYPDSVSVPLSGKAKAIELLMAGSTNHMQCHIENARVKVYYADGSSESLSLVAPVNWCPIEQDYFIDGFAFRLETPRPYRMTFKDVIVSNNLEKDLNISGVYGRRIDGGAGIMLCLPLDDDKELSRLTLETFSNDIVVGLVAATYLR